MKIWFLFSFLTSCYFLKAQPTPGELIEDSLKKSPTENCIVKYTITGDANGMATRFISSWGWEERYEQELTYARYGLSNTEKKIMLRIGLNVYQIDPEKNEGKVTYDKTLKDLLAYKSLEETHDALFEDKGGLKTGTQSHLGKTVNVWKFKKGTTNELWEWKGIVLKEIKNIQDINYTITATNMLFDQPENVDFDIPENIKLTQE